MIKIIEYKSLISNSDGVLLHCDDAFSGIVLTDNSLETIINGCLSGIHKGFKNGNVTSILNFYENSKNGYELHLEFIENFNYIRSIYFWDMDFMIESFSIDKKGILVNYFTINDDSSARQRDWVKNIEFNKQDPTIDKNQVFLSLFNLQNELKEKVIVKDDLPSEIKYIGGVDVAYNELEERVVAGIVILDAQTLQLVEEVTHEDKVSFPYVPGLFSFREVPPLLEAFKKLKTKPDLIVCDGHGIAHPKGVGMATHLGIELNIPTIGCAKKRLVGYYEEPESKRGSNSPMIFASKDVGKALRTQDGVKPVFVSVGHKISIETACQWILHLTPNYRLPETTRAVDSLVNKLMKERTDWDTPLEFYQKKMEEQQKGDSGTQQ